jgi:hypothetical protein
VEDKPTTTTMMVDGPDIMEAHAHPEESGETNPGTMMQRDADTSQQITSPTTTISTIAVQSGETRVVIALLQVRSKRCRLINNNSCFLSILSPLFKRKEFHLTFKF